MKGINLLSGAAIIFGFILHLDSYFIETIQQLASNPKANIQLY